MTTNKQVFKNITTSALAVFNIAVCAFGAAGWYLIVQNNATGDLAFAICGYCAVMAFVGFFGLVHQCGLLQDIK